MKKKILVVDDSATLRASVNYTLKSAGFETINAVNGADGLEKLTEAHKQGDQIGIILSDINMPVMDGMQLIREIHKIDQADRVLVVSGSIDDEVIKELKSFGCHHWLAKPFLVTQLMEAVQQTQGRRV